MFYLQVFLFFHLDCAFSECENLEEVVLSKNLKKLNYRTFADHKNPPFSVVSYYIIFLKKINKIQAFYC